MAYMYYMHQREYTFRLGRFLSIDPVGGNVGSSQSWNRYSYVWGNPVNLIDPYGELQVKLGQHTDEEIDERTKEIKAKLKEEGLSKEERKALRDEKSALAWERQGNRRVGGMLAALDRKGERGSLQVSDFTLTTDPANDFQGQMTSQNIAGILQTDAFHVGGAGPLAGQLFIRTDAGFYPRSATSSDWFLFGASALRHEGEHKYSAANESSAFGVQRRVFGLFRGEITGAFFTKWDAWMEQHRAYYQSIGR